MRLSQLDVAACREAYAAHDSDAARLRAMLNAAHLDAADEVVLDLCSQVAVQRPLHAVHETAQHPPGGGGGAAPSHDAQHGGASFEILLRMVELQARGAEDAEEDNVLAFAALGGNVDKTGVVSADRLRAVCKEFGLLVDLDEFLAATDGGAENLDFERFMDLLA